MPNPKLVNLISSVLGIEPDHIRSEASLYEDFNAGPLEISELMAKVCQTFMIDDRLHPHDDIATVGDIEHYVEAYSDEI